MGTEFEAPVESINEKGATVNVEGEVEAFCFNRELVKEDGTMPVKGETLKFRVTELKRSAKRIVLSHVKTYSAAAASKTEKVASDADATKRAVKKINTNIEKATLGDIDALAALKEQLQKGE